MQTSLWGTITSLAIHKQLWLSRWAMMYIDPCDFFYVNYFLYWFCIIKFTKVSLRSRFSYIRYSTRMNFLYTQSTQIIWWKDLDNKIKQVLTINAILWICLPFRGSIQHISMAILCVGKSVCSLSISTQPLSNNIFNEIFFRFNKRDKILLLNVS